MTSEDGVGQQRRHHKTGCTPSVWAALRLGGVCECALRSSGRLALPRNSRAGYLPGIAFAYWLAGRSFSSL